jgi:hypothetical protein
MTLYTLLNSKPFQTLKPEMLIGAISLLNTLPFNSLQPEISCVQQTNVNWGFENSLEPEIALEVDPEINNWEYATWDEETWA